MVDLLTFTSVSYLDTSLDFADNYDLSTILT